MKKKISGKTLTVAEVNDLLNTMKTRFEKHRKRHEDISWETVYGRLEKVKAKLWSLREMENTGGEPDVIGVDEKSGEIIFYDCSPESPAGRRSLCYDDEALRSRKEHKPSGSAVDMAEAMGVTLLTEEKYRQLQQLGEFDRKTSSWIFTPGSIRKLGGAVFCDRRYNTVFLYHNGAKSYYAARGFRSELRV